VTATNGASIQFVFIHDGGITNGNVTDKNGHPNGQATCFAPGATSFTVPSGDCGCT
jgi:hypothetical protein